MNTILTTLLILASIFQTSNANWYPSSKLSLGVFPDIKSKGMHACLLNEDTYISAYRDSTLFGVNHFSWKETGFKSEVKFYDGGYILKLMCLKNGRYVILTSNPEYNDNFTFTFFDSNGDKTHSFEFNDTNIYVYEITVEESPNGNLVVYSPQPSEVHEFIGYIYILDQNGTKIARKEIPFNIPEGALVHNIPSSYTKMRTFPDENNNIYLVTFNAEWEKDLNLSEIAYFPKQNYYNISILDQTLSTIAGPIKKYSPRTHLQFFIEFMGSDKFVMVRADIKEQTLNSTFYSTDLVERSSDFIKIDALFSIWVRAMNTPDNGFILFGQGNKVMHWQKYYHNETRKGPLVNLNSTYLYHRNIELRNEDDFGLIYTEENSNEVFFTRASSFRFQVNSAKILEMSVLILLIILFSFM